MKKFVFAIFTLMAVGLFTNPLFAKHCNKVPECAASCSFMQSCWSSSAGNLDIYNCSGGYATVISDRGSCNNCRWDVEMKSGDFFVNGTECRP